MSFDPLTATGADLRVLLEKGELTSEQALRTYFSCVEKYDGYLQSIAELSPVALDKARESDAARKDTHPDAKGRPGLLAGIPVLIKDNIATAPEMGMGTRAGAAVFKGSVPGRNAPIVEKLLDAGAIIMGKATLSEYSYFKGSGIHCGWSALRGQGQSPYVRGGHDNSDGLNGHSNPGGSSSGSAISVAAGLAPMSIGSETYGSLVVPAAKASLYTLKPTLGIIPNEGIVPVSKRYDTAGPMAKCVRDIADLLTVLVDAGKTNVPDGGYAAAIGNELSWKELKVGTLTLEQWLRQNEVMVKPVEEATQQMLRGTHAAYQKIKDLAGTYHPDVPLRPAKDFEIDGEDQVFTMLVAEFKDSMDSYLSSLDVSAVRTLEDIRDWNANHPEEAFSKEYPNQDRIDQGCDFKDTPEKLSERLAHIKSVASSLNSVFNDYDIDVVIGPGDGNLQVYSAALGYPIAAVPLSYLDFNGRPLGLTMIVRAHQEAVLMKAMGAFEATFPARKPPHAFLDAI